MSRITILIISLCLTSHALGKILPVPDGYATIQTALFSARSGDTVLVAPGT